MFNRQSSDLISQYSAVNLIWWTISR